jgi:hypothetical protein
MWIFPHIEVGLFIVSDSCLAVSILGHTWDFVERIAAISKELLLEFGALETTVSSERPMSLRCGIVYR